jgi:hypothetical protein
VLAQEPYLSANEEMIQAEPFTARNIMWRLSVLCSLILLAFSFTYATSVVASLGRQRIILEADTRADRLGPGFSGNVPHFRDDSCKIIPLGPTAVAVSGYRDYKRNVKTDPVSDWDALLDAKAAYAEQGYNLHEMAKDWARRSAGHFDSFYAAAPQRVRQLASGNPDHVLVDAFVVGWQGRIPLLYWEKVYLDERVSSPIQMSEQLLPYRELPYTMNSVTQELIEGNSQRMRDAAAKWKEWSLTIPTNEHDWRWVEFLIKSTGSYEESVGQKVNVIQIPAGGQAEWLQNLTCRE